MDPLAFIRDPDRWPCHPVLPVVNRLYKPGIVLAGDAPVVYEVNMYGLKTGLLAPQLARVPTHTYTSYEEMLEDGWRID